ncbi:MAG: M28 family peptidase [Bacteriovoracaceae bacterium]|nr:M28 family peptidase [Bacteriovoracaceae bacterium]
MNFILLGFFTLSLHASEINQSSQLKSFIKKVKQTDLMTTVRDFVAASRPSRMVGKAGHLKAREYLINKIKELDPLKSGTITEQTFLPNVEKGKLFYELDFRNKIVGTFEPSTPEYIKWKNFTEYIVAKVQDSAKVSGMNIIWEKKAKNSKELLIVGAHYDTISHDKDTLKIKEQEEMPGADYNASGVAMALNIIKLLAQVELEKSVRVVFFDYQGLGFLGSAHFIEELSKEVQKTKIDVNGLINLEMLGHDSKVFDKNKQNGNMALYLSRPSQSTHIRDRKLSTFFLNKGIEFTNTVDFQIKDNGFDSSDHVRFWEKGFAAITFSQDWEDDFNNKNYQTPNDFPETINQDTYYQSFLFIAGATTAWVMDLQK